MTAPSRPPSTLNRCCLGLANLGVCPHCVSGRQHPNPASPSLRYSPIERARRLITVAMWRPRDPDVNVAERSPTQTSVPEAWASGPTIPTVALAARRVFFKTTGRYGSAWCTGSRCLLLSASPPYERTRT